MDSWSNLLLMCGLVTAALLNQTTGHGHKISDAVNTLQNHHGLKETKWVGEAVFTPYLGKIEDTCTCEKMMLLRMLHGYMEIFSDMLKKANTTETKSSLTELQESVKQLKDKYKEEQAVWKKIQEIDSLQKDNRMIQGGAVNDFISVYDKALEAGQQAKKSPSGVEHKSNQHH